MKRWTIVSFSILFLGIFQSWAAPGDTTKVIFHKKTDMTWYGNYDVRGKFPDAGKSWRQILLRYTMGCASGGCSGWDYTTHIQLLQPTGILDSSIQKIDTTQSGIDTTWKVFEIQEKWELARVITPYGTYMKNNTLGFNNQWTHDHWFDVTDFASLLHDSATLRAFYSGWSSGFSATTEFIFIEGDAPRPVLKLHNLWGKGGNGYSFKDSASFNALVFPTFTFKPQSNTTSARLWHIPSGHGFDNDQYAAEFYPEPFHVLVNDKSVERWVMWDDKCGENPIQPQGGTWIFDRANWCPGMPVGVFSKEIGTALKMNDSNRIAIKYEDYSWSGSQTPSYAISTILAEYGPYKQAKDVRLDAIIAPNDDVNFAAQNPNCMYPVIRFSNQGHDTLRNLDIQFQVEGNVMQSQTWTGLLAPGASETFNLMHPDWRNSSSARKFTVNLLLPGENITHDNRKTVQFTPPPKHPSKFIIWFKTNRRAGENRYELIDEYGKIVYSKSFTDTMTIHKDTVQIPLGCITFKVYDDGGDGIDWWNNRASAGVGYLHWRNMSGTVIKRFEPDFGSEIEYQFTTEFGLLTEELIKNNIHIYPNPSKENVHISVGNSGNHHLCIYDLQGKLLSTQMIQEEADISLLSYPAGLLIFSIQTHDGNYHHTRVIHQP